MIHLPVIELIIFFDSEDEDEWGSLQMLCFRYSLVATTQELSFLSLICFEADSYRMTNNDEYFILSSVDMEDARNVLEAFITRMTPSSSRDWFPSELMVLLIDFVGQDVMLDLVDLMPQFLSILFSWPWEQLDLDVRTARDLSANNELIRYATHTFDIVK